MAGSALALPLKESPLFFGLLLGAWLHSRFGKPTVQGGWWDFALGLVIVMWVLKAFLQVIGAWPLLEDVLGILPLAILVIAAVISLFANRPVDESTLGQK
jgi:hypothetical protein